MSSAFADPINLGSNQAMPCSATRPRWAKAVVNFAESLAIRMSQKSVKTSPMPAHGPLMAAMIGFGHSNIYPNRPSKCSSTEGPRSSSNETSASSPFSTMRFLPSPLASIFCKPPMSAPAQKPRPAPVMTITRTSSSAAASLMAPRTLFSIVAVQAFNLSGRLSVMVATRSATS